MAGQIIMKKYQTSYMLCRQKHPYKINNADNKIIWYAPGWFLC